MSKEKKRAPIVYFCHEYGGNDAVKEDLEPKIKELVKKYDIVPVSPIHNCGFLYDTVDYDTGFEYCRRLLVFAYCLVVFGDKSNSKGCKREKKYCKDNEVPIVEFKDFDKWYKAYMGDDYDDKREEFIEKKTDESSDGSKTEETKN